MYVKQLRIPLHRLDTSGLFAVSKSGFCYNGRVYQAGELFETTDISPRRVRQLVSWRMLTPLPATGASLPKVASPKTVAPPSFSVDEDSDEDEDDDDTEPQAATRGRRARKSAQ